MIVRRGQLGGLSHWGRSEFKGGAHCGPQGGTFPRLYIRRICGAVNQLCTDSLVGIVRGQGGGWSRVRRLIRASDIIIIIPHFQDLPGPNCLDDDVQRLRTFLFVVQKKKLLMAPEKKMQHSAPKFRSIFGAEFRLSISGRIRGQTSGVHFSRGEFGPRVRPCRTGCAIRGPNSGTTPKSG